MIVRWIHGLLNGHLMRLIIGSNNGPVNVLNNGSINGSIDGLFAWRIGRSLSRCGVCLRFDLWLRLWSVSLSVCRSTGLWFYGFVP